jgi:hypothetical protein
VLVALLITAAVFLPVTIGAIAGIRVKAGPSYRQAPIVAWICALALLLPGFVALDVATPESACGNTQCDTANGIGMAFLSIPVFALALIGVATGRLLSRRGQQRQPPSPPGPCDPIEHGD